MIFYFFLSLQTLTFFFTEMVALQTNDTQGRFVQEQNQYNSIKAIIFDCDGTLVDNGVGYFLDWQHALKCQGYELNKDLFWDFMNRNKLVGAPGADKIIVKYCCELLGRECADEILKDKQEFSKKLHQTY